MSSNRSKGSNLPDRYWDARARACFTRSTERCAGSRAHTSADHPGGTRVSEEEIQQEVWHYRGQVEVVRPLVVAGQLAVLPIVGTLIAAFLSLPYVSESWKARRERMKESKTPPASK